MSQQSLFQAKTKAGPLWSNLPQQSSWGELSHVTKSKLLRKTNTVFFFKVILFRGAKRFTHFDYKITKIERQ